MLACLVAQSTMSSPVTLESLHAKYQAMVEKLDVQSNMLDSQQKLLEEQQTQLDALESAHHPHYYRMKGPVPKHYTVGRRKGPSLKVPTLTPYYTHAIQDYQKKSRPPTSRYLC